MIPHYRLKYGILTLPSYLSRHEHEVVKHQ